jgi:hypothetical protein
MAKGAIGSWEGPTGAKMAWSELGGTDQLAAGQFPVETGCAVAADLGLKIER